MSEIMDVCFLSVRAIVFVYIDVVGGGLCGENCGVSRSSQGCMWYNVLSTTTRSTLIN